MKKIRWVNLLLELCVVIFGVTIAFTLNNWGESRKTRQLEQEYLRSIQNDLEKDTVDLAQYVDTLQVQKKNCLKLIRAIQTNDLESDSLLDYSLSLFFVTSFIPHSATYKSITYSGQLQTLSDFELRKDIIDLYDINHAEIRLLDEFNKNQVFNYRTPFLHDNIQYGRGGILNTEVMTTPKYVNMTMSTYYFLDKKITVYREALQKSKSLIREIENKLK